MILLQTCRAARPDQASANQTQQTLWKMGMSFDQFKSIKIRVLRNGDVHTFAKKMVLSRRVYRNFEQFLHAVSDAVKLVSGAVRRIYRIDGLAIKHFDELEDGGLYVATSGETLKKVQYQTASDEIDAQQALSRMRSARMNAASEVRQRVRTSSYFKKGDKAIRVICFANGQFTEHAGRLLLSHKNCRNFDEFLLLLSQMLKPQTGHVRKVYNAQTHQRVMGMKDIVDGLNAVGLGLENYRRGPYSIVKLDQEKKPDDAELRKIITVFPNGDSLHNGWTVSVKPSKYPNLKKLMENLNKQITLVTGLISQVYTIEGYRVQTIEQLEMNGNYILASSQEPFIACDYNVRPFVSLPEIPPPRVSTVNNGDGPRLSSSIKRPQIRLSSTVRKPISRPRTVAKQSTISEESSKPVTPQTKPTTAPKRIIKPTTAELRPKSVLKTKKKTSTEQLTQRPKSVRVAEIEEDDRARNAKVNDEETYESKNIREMKSKAKAMEDQKAKSPPVTKPIVYRTVEEDPPSPKIQPKVAKEVQQTKPSKEEVQKPKKEVASDDEEESRSRNPSTKRPTSTEGYNSSGANSPKPVRNALPKQDSPSSDSFPIQKTKKEGATSGSFSNLLSFKGSKNNLSEQKKSSDNLREQQLPALPRVE